MNTVLASFIFFTRLPFWKIKAVPDECFKHVVPYWPLVGWFTGGVSAFVYALMTGLFHLTPIVAFLIVLIVRMLITGALHEDGLADFFDGFGGGKSREQILAIMKDSHIGTYGVLALICYVFLWILLFLSLHSAMRIDDMSICYILFASDIWAKWCASQIINLLPYARKQEEAKNQTVYQRMSRREFFTGLAIAVLPQLFLLFSHRIVAFIITLFVTYLVMFALTRFIKRRIRGYTGDCCGALFLICELTYLFVACAMWNIF